VIRRITALASCIAFPAFADTPVSLTDHECPFGSRDVPAGFSASCSEMSWTDRAIAFRTLVAVIFPEDADEKAAPIIYLPGGPGDAPVNRGADIESILKLVPGRTLVTLNPRGVKGAAPRPTCEFGDDFWDEDVSPEREDQMVRECRDAVNLDMTAFDAPHLAKDINNLVNALGFERAGIFAISYGTETALHLLTRKPTWLGPVALDSVSMPGALGTTERLAARDRFLGVADRLCFAEKQCNGNVLERFDDLLDWSAQFDDAPLQIKLGPPDVPWSLDGQDMLDFLSSLAAYPDGAGYVPLFIEAFENSRDDTGNWVASELERGFEYAQNNFALLYGAFSDSAERNDTAPEAGSTRYPFDLEEQSSFARLFKIWNRSNRVEPRFVSATSTSRPAGVPVLILSGGVDSLTPVSWGLELKKRFSGMAHFVFPDLAHAVAFGTDSDVEDTDVAHQLRCGPRVVQAFFAGKPYADCGQYLRKADE